MSRWNVPTPDKKRLERRECIFLRLKTINEERGNLFGLPLASESDLRDSAAAIEVVEYAIGREPLPDWIKPRWPRDGWEPRIREADGGLDVIVHVTIRVDESATCWGWVFAEEAKRIGTRQTDWRHPAYTVASEHLRTMEDLLRLLASWDRLAG